MALSGLITRTLMLDLETTRSGRIRHIGAILNGHVFEKMEINMLQFFLIKYNFFSILISEF